MMKRAIIAVALLATSACAPTTFTSIQPAEDGKCYVLTSVKGGGLRSPSGRLHRCRRVGPEHMECRIVGEP